MPTPSSNESAVQRADGLPKQFRRRYPDALAALDAKAHQAQQSTPWPDWCWIPMAAASAYIQENGSSPLDIARVAALAAWRVGRGVYTLDPDVATAAVEQIRTVQGLQARTWQQLRLPGIEVFSRLPEWCVYIEVPQDVVAVSGWAGLFVHLEHDMRNGRPELRLVLDRDGTWDGLTPVPVYLDRPTLGAAVADFAAVTLAQATTGAGTDLRSIGPASPASTQTGLLVFAVLPLILAVVDDSALITGTDLPGLHPARAQQREGRWRPATTTQAWRVTYSPARPHLRLLP